MDKSFFNVVLVDDEYRIVLGNSLASMKIFKSEVEALKYIDQIDNWDLVASLIFISCNKLVDERLKMWGHVDNEGGVS